jgi:L-asparaginase II
LGELALLAEITRGDRVESVHHGSIAVVDGTGHVVAAVGDPEQFLFFRSSAKPFQAIPVVETGAADHFGFTAAELALCCASHNAEYRHQEQVRAMLAKLGLDEGALQCGIPLPSDKDEMGKVLAGQRAPSPLQCDCSGKHTGMLASCLMRGFPTDTYLDPKHPLQVEIRALVAEACGVAPDDLVLATDGCSLPTFGASLAAFARSYAVLARPSMHASALNRLREAMIAFPENVSGKGELVADLMQIGGGRIVAKSGAEGLICIGLPAQALGIAIRIADGSFRSHPVVVASVLRQLGVISETEADAIAGADDREVRNHNKRLVGERRAVFQLRQ